MEMDSDERDSDERDREKRRRTMERKLYVGEKVEVLRLDKEFAGSWHPGVTIDCGLDCHCVELTNRLNNDSHSKVVKRFTASAIGDLGGNMKDCRGTIRPMPPLFDTPVSDIRYGLCVDSLIGNAWWEGVVFDHEEGSAERLIFFPDRSVVQRITVDRLRLTLEWDEVSGHWKDRGQWMFLQLLDNFAQEDPLPVSAWEIWHDLRTTDAFMEKLRDWTSRLQHIWHQLVSELIQELLSVVNGLPSAGPRPTDPVTDVPMISAGISSQDVIFLEGTDFQIDGVAMDELVSNQGGELDSDFDEHWDDKLECCLASEVAFPSVVNGLPSTGPRPTDPVTDIPMISAGVNSLDVIFPEGTNFQIDGAAMDELDSNQGGELGSDFDEHRDDKLECCLASEVVSLSVVSGLPSSGPGPTDAVTDVLMISAGISSQDVIFPEVTNFQIDGAAMDELDSNQGGVLDCDFNFQIDGAAMNELDSSQGGVLDCDFNENWDDKLECCLASEVAFLSVVNGLPSTGPRPTDPVTDVPMISAGINSQDVIFPEGINFQIDGAAMDQLDSNQGGELDSEHLDDKFECCLASEVAGTWNPVKLEAEYCFDLSSMCADYLTNSRLGCKGSKVATHSETGLTLKKHLVHDGWRIETKRDRMIRFRYLSPGQKTYYSLNKVCFDLIKEQQEKNQKFIHDESLRGSCSDSKILFPKVHPEPASLASGCLEHTHLVSGDKNPAEQSINDTELLSGLNENLWGGCSDSKMLFPKVHPEPASLASDRLEHTHLLSRDKSPAEKSNNDAELLSGLNPVHLSDAIQKYIDYREAEDHNKDKVTSDPVKVLINNAKTHLQLAGWKLWMKKKNTKQELRYTTPKGRNYMSLFTACKAYVKEECENTFTEKSAKTMGLGKKSGNFIKMDTKCEPCILSTAVNKDEFQEAVVTSHEGAEEGSRFPSNCSDFGELGFGKLHQRGHRKANKRRMSNCSSFPKTSLHDRLPSQSTSSANYRKVKKRKTIVQDNGSSSSSRALRSGKRSRLVITRPPSQHISRTILTWLIEKEMVLPRHRVTYIRKSDGRAMKNGMVTHVGIKCMCCNKVFSLAKFEAHAGSTTRRPAASIFLPNGMSLLQCQMQIVHSNKTDYSARARLKSDYSHYESDSECSICHDGGLLLLCDHCPSAFHPNCVGLVDMPKGNWCCPSCHCRICGLGEFDADTDQFTEKSVLYCDQCEREYHVGCMRKGRSLQLRSCPTGSWTCSKICSKIFYHLRNLLGKPNPTRIEGLSWTVLRSSKENDADFCKFDDETISEHHSKLCIALDVFHECFETYIERRTMSDLVADILFNRVSELNRLNFWGFYTIILERGEELVSVATFRVLGEKVAEMPFIGTCSQFRRQGMCRLLVDELEKLLIKLGVERLVLPAVPQLLQTWTRSFGFTPMSNSDRLELSEYALLSFIDTTLCQKFLGTPTTIFKKQRDNCNRTNGAQLTISDNIKVVSDVHEIVGPLRNSSSPGSEICSLSDVGDTVQSSQVSSSTNSVGGQNKII